MLAKLLPKIQTSDIFRPNKILPSGIGMCWYTVLWVYSSAKFSYPRSQGEFLAEKIDEKLGIRGA